MSLVSVGAVLVGTSLLSGVIAAGSRAGGRGRGVVQELWHGKHLQCLPEG